MCSDCLSVLFSLRDTITYTEAYVFVPASMYMHVAQYSNPGVTSPIPYAAGRVGHFQQPWLWCV